MRYVIYCQVFMVRTAAITPDHTPVICRRINDTRGAMSDLLVVQRALGHADVSTTRIDTHLIDGQLEAALERL